VDFYFKALVQDKRFRIAIGAAAVSFVAMLLVMLTKARWAANVATFGLFPLFAASLLAVFVVLGLIVRHDYLQRKGRL
jgi:hypothetical protein